MAWRPTTERPPAPPPELMSATPIDWVQVWRRVMADPAVYVAPWTAGAAPVKVTAAVKAVGLAGCTWADFDDGTRIFPGNGILARVTGISERTAGLAISTICRLGFWWRYVDGSLEGRRGIASEYRLTIPADVLDGRVPMLTPEYKIPKAAEDQATSDHLISDHLISATGTPELSDRNTRTQIAPPSHYPPYTETQSGVLSLRAELEGRHAGAREQTTDADPRDWRAGQHRPAARARAAATRDGSA
jgi:hypothetical protein